MSRPQVGPRGDSSLCVWRYPLQTCTWPCTRDSNPRLPRCGCGYVYRRLQDQSDRRHTTGAPCEPRREPEGRRTWGRLFFGHLLLAKQKKVPCRRATPGIAFTLKLIPFSLRYIQTTVDPRQISQGKQTTPAKSRKPKRKSSTPTLVTPPPPHPFAHSPETGKSCH